MASGAITKVMPDNGNGYVRFPDGTQICWKYITKTNIATTKAWGSFYESDTLDFGNWPIAFTDVPAVSIVATGRGVVVESLRQTTATVCGNSIVMRPVTGTFDATFSIIGIGHWK